jgi:hypothetical protein
MMATESPTGLQGRSSRFGSIDVIWAMGVLKTTIPTPTSPPNIATSNTRFNKDNFFLLFSLVCYASGKPDKGKPDRHVEFAKVMLVWPRRAGTRRC